jgi:excisionase family DNA binding protein
MLGVSVATVADWANQGVLPHFKTAGGHRRFWREDVESFIRDQDPAA